MRTSTDRASRTRRPMSMRTREAVTGYLFIGLFVIGAVWIFIPALIEAVRMSFYDHRDLFSPQWVGIANYRWALAEDPDFIRDMVQTLGKLLTDVVVISFFSLFAATLLDRPMHGRGVFRAILFLPVAISTGVIALYMDWSAGGGSVSSGLSEIGGVVTVDTVAEYLASLNISARLTGIVMDAVTNIYAIITRSGVQTVIFLAGLQSISPAIYEAALVEGCTGWESFWKITLPVISPIISVNVVYTVVDSFAGADNTVMQRILRYITKDVDHGHATAMAFVYFLLVTLVLCVFLLVLRKITIDTEERGR